MRINLTKFKHLWRRLIIFSSSAISKLTDYQTWAKMDRKLLITITSIPLLLLVISIVLLQHRHNKYPVHFAKPNTSIQLTQSIKPQIPPVNLSHELNQVKSADKQRYQHLQDQLTAIESKLGALASDQSVSQLQQSVTAPNPTLLGKMDNLQSDVNTIIHQTAKKVFLNPKTVSQYFQLVAIQGFSDGMRAIIDVDGNQTTLGVNEVCPACRGWLLKSMDFTKQTATFENPHHQFVILQAK